VQQSIGQLDNGIKLRQTRRDIARVKTVVREKQVSR
jgi:ribosomal protein L29